MVRVKSPLVTAEATSEMDRTCTVRFCANWFTFSVKSFHVPEAPGTQDADPESKAKQPRAKRPNNPDREDCLLKTDRTGIVSRPVPA